MEEGNGEQRQLLATPDRGPFAAKERTSCSPGVSCPLSPLPLRHAEAQGGGQQPTPGGHSPPSSTGGEQGEGAGVKPGKAAPENQFLDRQRVSRWDSHVSPAQSLFSVHMPQKTF